MHLIGTTIITDIMKNIIGMKRKNNSILDSEKVVIDININSTITGNSHRPIMKIIEDVDNNKAIEEIQRKIMVTAQEINLIIM